MNRQNTPRAWCIMQTIIPFHPAVVSGMGRNRNTWDYEAKSKRTAQRWLKALREAAPSVHYVIEESR